MEIKGRPSITEAGKSFIGFYYLKAELADFCRANGLPASGSKEELTERVVQFFEFGKVKDSAVKREPRQKNNSVQAITHSTLIGPGFVCGEPQREYFKAVIGKKFSFNVAFQDWLKHNPGATYAQAAEMWHTIKAEEKNKTKVIDRQFEYNTYIRDFFADNKGRSLSDAILCWNYKKAKQGSNKYEREDLIVLG